MLLLHANDDGWLRSNGKRKIIQSQYYCSFPCDGGAQREWKHEWKIYHDAISIIWLIECDNTANREICFRCYWIRQNSLHMQSSENSLELGERSRRTGICKRIGNTRNCSFCKFTSFATQQVGTWSSADPLHKLQPYRFWCKWRPLFSIMSKSSKLLRKWNEF